MIETERLLLRELMAQDYGDLLRVFSSFLNSNDFADFNGHVRGWLNYYLEHQRRHGYSMYAVIIKSEGRLIGDCGLEFYEDIGSRSEVEIAYEYDRAFWGQGYGTEAATAVRDYAFGMLGITRLVSFISYDNIGSQQIVERIGLVRESEITKDGQRLILYAIYSTKVLIC